MPIVTETPWNRTYLAANLPRLDRIASLGETRLAPRVPTLPRVSTSRTRPFVPRKNYARAGPLRALTKKKK